MTREEIQQEAERVYADISREVGRGGSAAQIPLIADAISRAVSRAYEEAAQVADRKAREADEYAERESLPSDHGGDPSIAEEIRALKDSLTAETTRVGV
jgi:hypothetical protein